MRLHTTIQLIRFQVARELRKLWTEVTIAAALSGPSIHRVLTWALALLGWIAW